MAAIEACKEALLVSRLVGDLGFTELSFLLCDSQSDLMVEWNPVFYAKMKHI